MIIGFLISLVLAVALLIGGVIVNLSFYSRGAMRKLRYYRHLDRKMKSQDLVNRDKYYTRLHDDMSRYALRLLRILLILIIVIGMLIGVMLNAMH